MAIALWKPPEKLDGSDLAWPLSRLGSLSYVIGVLLKGDGSVFEYRRREERLGRVVEYRSFAIQLQVKSPDFANHFNTKLSEVLKRPPVRIRGPDKTGMFFATHKNLRFGSWWKEQNLGTLRDIIESFPKEYISGRFDSEANVNAHSVTVFGAEDHREQMKFDRDLCAELGMRVGLVRVYCTKGTTSYIHGRLVVATMDKLRFHVNAKDFLRVIGGLAVKERDLRLRAMIKGRRWTSWPPGTRRRAIELFQEGLNCKQISARLAAEQGLAPPQSTIYFWIKRGTRSWADFDRIRHEKWENRPSAF